MPGSIATLSPNIQLWRCGQATFFERGHPGTKFDNDTGAFMTETMFTANHHCLSDSAIFPEMDITNVNLLLKKGADLPHIPVALMWTRTSPSPGSGISVLTTLRSCSGFVYTARFCSYFSSLDERAGAIARRRYL